MKQHIAMLTEGRLSLFEGEGEGEGLFRIPVEIEPLTFILSPSRRGEAATTPNIVLF
jgi:hypothetical protein